MNKFKTAIKVYRADGLRSLSKKSLDFLQEELSNFLIFDRIFYGLSLRRLERLTEEEEGLNDVIDTVFQYNGFGRYKSIEAMQHKTEFRQILQEVSEKNPEVVMEIGTARGGTLYAWARYLGSVSKIISLDLPHGEFGGGYSKKKAEFFQNFSDKELRCVRKDSHKESTFEEVKEELAGDEIDFLFIDGDHTYEGVKQDFEMYKPLVAENGIIAFHDIVDHPNEPECNVDRFWSEIKEKYEVREIIGSDDQDWGGIGVVYL